MSMNYIKKKAQVIDNSILNHTIALLTFSNNLIHLAITLSEPDNIQFKLRRLVERSLQSNGYRKHALAITVNSPK